jgi:hypothetical protein
MRKYLFLVTAAFLLAGCQSPKGVYPTGLVYLDIAGRTHVEVRDATRAVLRENGYTEVSVFDYDMVFEKAASKGDTRMYGSIAPEQGWERVYLRIRQKPDGIILLDCDAFLVENRGEGLFERERALGVTRKGRYRELLEQVQNRLMPTPKSTEPKENSP